MKTLLPSILLCALFVGLGEFVKRSSHSPHYMNPHFIRGVERTISFREDFTNPVEVKPYMGNYDTAGQFVVEQLFHLEEAQSGSLAVRIEGLMSYEVFWNGELIGKNGVTATNDAPEEEGKLRGIFVLPEITTGQQILTLKASNMMVTKIRIFSIVIGKVDELYKYPFLFILAIHLLAGVFMVIGFYYIIEYFNGYSKSHLFFGLLCVLFFLLISLEYVRYYWNYHYSFHYQRLLMIEILTFLASFLLPYFFYLNFHLKQYSWILLALLASLAFVELRILSAGHDLRIMYLYGIAILFSSIFILLAYLKKDKDIKHSALGIIPSFVVFFYYDLLLFAGFVNLIVFNLLSIAKDQKRTRAERDQAKLASTRLELELIKKNIQPHFLMNTLTSIIEWIEKDPKVGIEMIEALAEEYQVLLKMANQNLVSALEEISLCKTHLNIMSYRKGAHYSLEVESEFNNRRIPPGIFLTIIENGISHSQAHSSVQFSIKEDLIDESIHYQVRAVGQMLIDEEPSLGLGTSYIQARLQESFPDKWELNQQAIQNGWLTTITLHRQ